jgi:hypothetical protein
MMAETSSSAATISRWACVPVPAISSPVSSVRGSELEMRQRLDGEVTAERWTRLDRVLAREAGAADGGH